MEECEQCSDRALYPEYTLRELQARRHFILPFKKFELRSEVHICDDDNK